MRRGTEFPATLVIVPVSTVFPLMPSAARSPESLGGQRERARRHAEMNHRPAANKLTHIQQGTHIGTANQAGLFDEVGVPLLSGVSHLCPVISDTPFSGGSTAHYADGQCHAVKHFPP